MATSLSSPLNKASSISTFDQANRWITMGGRKYVVIEELENFDPFFLNIVSAEDLWLFCSSHGSLSAGRRSPDHALFPYETVDKILHHWNTNGPWTGIKVDDEYWYPFQPTPQRPPHLTRRLMKSAAGDEVVFEEYHDEAQLTFRYRWQLSRKFGFVRTAELINDSSSEIRLRLVDGLDHFLPSGVDARMQRNYSCLSDAYKLSELHCDGGLLIHYLAAGITDEPIPLESLRATTIWSEGLGEGPTFLTRAEAENFLTERPFKNSSVERGHHGAYFLGRDLMLEPGERKKWVMVAELDQDHATVSHLKEALQEPSSLMQELHTDVEKGRDRLHNLIASADGFQETSDRDASLHHYHNTLCNILRGGVPEKDYFLKREPFRQHLKTHLGDHFLSHQDWLETLPETLTRSELLQEAATQNDDDLLRIAGSYLPLILSRRHGDPSRPWNLFNIRVRDDAGHPIHHFEGNWRDIFQNWEALSWSFPGFLDSFLNLFLNASTIDGHNPYRITSSGVDWESPDENDPWASIGYWGDHQIIYLLKLLELKQDLDPSDLSSRLNEMQSVYADVPYRLRGWEDTLTDPRTTVNFDEKRNQHLIELREVMGAEGSLLRNNHQQLIKATLLEKLLLPAVIKLANLIPGGGVWMNTQRPEWNDANNALAGYGLSLVTTAYLYRYLGFLDQLLKNEPSETFTLTPALGDLITIMDQNFDDPRWHETISDQDRYQLAEIHGRAAEAYRKEAYSDDLRDPAPFPHRTLMGFIQKSRRAAASTLRQSQRSDGLWHSYNTLGIEKEAHSLNIDHLALMLEGQVAILSSGLLSPTESLSVITALSKSGLLSPRHQTYLLYPDEAPVPFLERNLIEKAEVDHIPSLQKIIKRDPSGNFRFHPDLVNGYALETRMDSLNIPAADRTAISELYENTFRHHSFTGRSGRMYGYEGLGCIYWHMVSKLMLAVQEITHQATDPAEINLLRKAYYEVQRGLGFRKTPQDYGAFPAEPYSHSPSHAGAQQPGLTGQAKEGILCRFGELGVSFHQGRLQIRPTLLREAEFGQSGELSFTLAGTSFVYHRREDLQQVTLSVYFHDRETHTFDEGYLDEATTRLLTNRTGEILKIVVQLPSTLLVR